VELAGRRRDHVRTLSRDTFATDMARENALVATKRRSRHELPIFALSNGVALLWGWKKRQENDRSVESKIVHRHAIRAR
jgi:hypothetical protein